MTADLCSRHGAASENRRRESTASLACSIVQKGVNGLSSLAQAAGTATPAGVLGAIIGALVWSSSAAPLPDCEASYCPLVLDVGLFAIPSIEWACVDFGIVGVAFGL